MTGMRVQRTLMAAAVLGLCACDGTDKPPGFQAPEPPEVLYGTVRARDTSGRVDGADLTAVVRAQNQLTLKLFAALRAENPQANLAVGGYTVHQVLGMLYAGARGTTAEQLAGVLAWPQPADRLHTAMNALDLELRSRGDDVTLAVANRVWAQRGLPVEIDFLDRLTRDYGAPLAVTDFAADSERARGEINGWVAQATADKIRELFPAGTIHGQTVLTLVSALYLHAPWKYKFNPAATRLQPFTRYDGVPIDVPTMHFDDFLPSGRGVDWQAVELPYRGDELSMVVIAPTSLAALEARLTLDMLEAMFKEIDPGGIHLSLPRWTFAFHTSLVPALKGMGLTNLFEGADLSGIAPGLAGVQHVEHEVFVKVDEEGTEAAAATGAAVPASHGPTVQIDRPFLFVIRDRLTGAFLFLGRVTDPR
jgi:serpin B